MHGALPDEALRHGPVAGERYVPGTSASPETTAPVGDKLPSTAPINPSRTTNTGRTGAGKER